MSSVYRVLFHSQDKVYEVYAKGIYQSDMYGFIEIEEFVFGENSQVIVDPAEEKLKTEFNGVLRSYVPMHNIIRIDEVEKTGVPKITDADEIRLPGTVTNFPVRPKSTDTE